MATLTKRQKQLLDYLNGYIGQFGYAPTLQEIGSYFGLSSLATIHKHLKNLEAKGFIKRKWNHSRALEMVDHTVRGAARELPMLGRVAAGTPIEAIEGNESITVPEEFIRRQNTFCLRVRGESMIDEGIRDGDYIIVEGREVANEGETVVALVNGEATVKKFYREADGRIRLEPANVTMQPIYASEEDLMVRGVVVGLMRHYR
ncbi:MAG TPA: transcriptional repressor LexA [Candidatus Binataceae bacterium]|nr:transcriptional repressor LexA [Candidatus Binataceae bacterium]